MTGKKVSFTWRPASLGFVTPSYRRTVAYSSQTVATFTDPGGAEDLGDYSATIAWGDNSSSPGDISYSGGVFTVSGSHTYVEEAAMASA